MNNNDAIKRIVTFVLLAFALSSPFYVLIASHGGLEVESNAFYVIALMWMPAVAGMLTTWIFQRNLKGMGWQRGAAKYYAIAYLTPVLYAGVAYTAIWLLGLGGLNFSQQGTSGLVISLTVGVLSAFITAVGEEIGWRGVLVPQLARVNSYPRTALISGVIWGFWHIPLIVFGGYSSGAPTWYAVIMFMVVVIGMSFAFAWIRLASGAIWTAAIMHSVHNSFIQSFLDKVTVDTGATPYFATEFGAALAVMAIIVAVIFSRIGLPEATELQS